MNILHITDFHYSKETKYQAAQLRLIDSFIDSLGKIKTKIDYVFFTGDLVFSGESIEDFYAVKKLFIDRICQELKLSINEILLCPGNHDVFRGQEIDGIHTIINNLIDNNQVDDFVLKQDKKSLKASLENLANYNSFQSDFYTSHVKEYKDEIIDGMYTSHIREVDNKKISITSINSAWRANDSKTDSGKRT